MYDKELLLEILNQTVNAVQKVIKRFEPVGSVKVFTDTQRGMEKLDAICMVLVAIGESLKNIDRITDKKLLLQYPEVDWKGAKGMRDIISHQYFDIDAEEIYWACEKNMKPLARTLEKIILDISSTHNC